MYYTWSVKLIILLLNNVKNVKNNYNPLILFSRTLRGDEKIIRNFPQNTVATWNEGLASRNPTILIVTCACFPVSFKSRALVF